jgi:hypothetical protein
VAKPSSGTKLVAVAAAVGGFRGEALTTAIAVSLAENRSSNPRARGDRNNPRPGCQSVGLWQINTCPARDGAGPPRYGSDPDRLTDPVVNARSAHTISGGGTNWSPWSTFKDGKYRAHLDEARGAALWLIADDEAEDMIRRLNRGENLPEVTGHGVGLGDVAAGVAGAVSSPLAAVAALATAMQSIFRFLTSWATWRAALFVVLGLVLLGGAVALVVADLRTPDAPAAGDRPGDAPPIPSTT